MLFCCKFITVYTCQKLLTYSLVWQNYCKHKTAQFFWLTMYKANSSCAMSLTMEWTDDYWPSLHWSCRAICRLCVCVCVRPSVRTLELGTHYPYLRAVSTVPRTRVSKWHRCPRAVLWPNPAAIPRVYCRTGHTRSTVSQPQRGSYAWI